MATCRCFLRIFAGWLVTLALIEIKPSFHCVFLIILVFFTKKNSLKVLYKQSIHATHLYDYCNLPNRLSLPGDS